MTKVVNLRVAGPPSSGLVAIRARQDDLDGRLDSFETDAQSYADAKVQDVITSGVTDVAPAQNAVFNALATKEPTITAGTTAQYWRGDKSWQTLNKAAVGLSNVDNTSDANKPVSTAAQTALDGKANLNLGNTTNTGIVIDRTVTLAADTTYTGPVMLTGTAQFNLNGHTLTFSGGIIAPLRQIFTGTGYLTGVTIASGTNDWAYPEWWGAVSSATGMPATDSAAAINAALAAYNRVSLTGRIYTTTAATVKVSGSRKLFMCAPGTSLFSASSTLDIFVFGDDAGGGYTAESQIHNVTTLRTVGCTMPGSVSNDYTLPKGIKYSKLVSGCKAYNCLSYDSPIGHYYNDTGGLEVYSPQSLRQNAFTSQRYYGHYIDGERNNGLGYASPNASLKIYKPNAGSIAALSSDYGIYGVGALADLYLDHPEIGGFVASGLRLIGDGSRSGCIDINVICPIIDAWKNNAIYISGLGLYGQATITGGYNATAPSASGNGIDIQSDGVTIVDHKSFNYALAATAVAVNLNAVKKFNVDIECRDFESAATINGACSDGELMITADKSAAYTTPGNIAVTVSGASSHLKINAGTSGNFGIGVSIASGASYITTDVTRSTINSASKVFYNGTSVYSSQGNSGSGSTVITGTTNVVQGVM